MKSPSLFSQSCHLPSLFFQSYTYLPFFFKVGLPFFQKLPLIFFLLFFSKAFIFLGGVWQGKELDSISGTAGCWCCEVAQVRDDDAQSDVSDFWGNKELPKLDFWCGNRAGLYWKYTTEERKKGVVPIRSILWWQWVVLYMDSDLNSWFYSVSSATAQLTARFLVKKCCWRKERRKNFPKSPYALFFFWGGEIQPPQQMASSNQTAAANGVAPSR